VSAPPAKKSALDRSSEKAKPLPKFTFERGERARWSKQRRYHYRIHVDGHHRGELKLTELGYDLLLYRPNRKAPPVELASQLASQEEAREFLEKGWPFRLPG
jgi:hypothetical protein